MSTTPHLGLPLIAAAQAQKHVTHNEAIFALDALVHCAILDKDLAAAPASPAEGDRYIVAAAPTGEWAGWAGLITIRQDGAWLPITPQIGFIAYVVDEALLYVFTAGGWHALTDALTAIQNLGRLGIGTVADAANPFSAKLNAALWAARGVSEGGTGDLRYTLDKEATGNVLSLLFQTGFSGRAEIGLVGSDQLVAKVSPDGAAWHQSFAIDPASGSFDFLSAETTVASASTVDLGAQPTRRVAITGTTAITSFGTVASRERLVRFAGALTLTHNATTLDLRNGGGNVTTAAGDVARFVSDSSGNWSLADYSRAGASVWFNGAHATTNPDGATRGLTSGDTATVSGASNGFHFLTSLRNAGTHGAQIALGDTISGTYVRRLTSGSWGGWRALAEQGANASFSAGTFTAVNGFSMRNAAGGTDQKNFDIQNNNATVSFRFANDAYLAATAFLSATRSGTTPTGVNVFAVLQPSSDNAIPLGTTTRRWTEIFAATGTINTSDGREKTGVAPLTPAEIDWARDLAAEIGTFRFLAAIEAKGEGARVHVGLTVQRAIALGEARGLDPLRYGFICRDEWEAEEGRAAIEAVPAVHDESGTEIERAVPGEDAIPPRPAGDRYGFRPDQLALFIARGHEARLAAIESFSVI